MTARGGATPIFTPSVRDATLAQLVELLEADERLDAAIITGSLAVHAADRWSDIDLATVIADTNSAENVADDWISRMYRDFPVAHHYLTRFGSTIVPGFLLSNGLEVDLAFTPAAEFKVWAPVEVVFDRSGAATRAAGSPQAWTPNPDWSAEAGFAWHDILHAWVAARRGKPWKALYFLQRVRNRTLGLASERHGWNADEFGRVDELPPYERDALEASLVGRLDLEELLRATEIAARAFLTELRRGDEALADRLEPPLLAFITAETRESSWTNSTPRRPSEPIRRTRR